MIAQAFQSTKTNVNLLPVRFSTHLNIPQEIWISSLEAPSSLPHMSAIAAAYLLLMSLLRPDYFAGVAKSIADCLNFAITFTGHVNFLIK